MLSKVNLKSGVSLKKAMLKLLHIFIERAKDPCPSSPKTTKPKEYHKFKKLRLWDIPGDNADRPKDDEPESHTDRVISEYDTCYSDPDYGIKFKGIDQKIEEKVKVDPEYRAGIEGLEEKYEKRNEDEPEERYKKQYAKANLTINLAIRQGLLSPSYYNAGPERIKTLAYNDNRKIIAKLYEKMWCEPINRTTLERYVKKWIAEIEEYYDKIYMNKGHSGGKK